MILNGPPFSPDFNPGYDKDLAVMQTVLSHTFYAGGEITGGDQRYVFPPWEDVDITIIGVALMVYEGGEANYTVGTGQPPYAPIDYVGACNNNPAALDVMTYWSPGGSRHNIMFYPAGCGVPIPAGGGPNGDIRVDFHLGGRGLGAHFQIFMTVYYVKNPPPTPETA